MTARFITAVMVMVLMVGAMFYSSREQWNVVKGNRVAEKRMMPAGYFDDEKQSSVTVASSES
jgi:hypothetical protein